MTVQKSRYVLGVDLGTNSAGWAVLRLGPDEQPVGVERLGVRAFDAGVEGDVEQGKDESRAKPRREARLRRRQLERRGRRMARLFHILQDAGLLPEGDSSTPEARNALLNELDRRLSEALELAADHRKAQLLPYILRAQALDRKLAPHELGRALYHLAQRRGFLSNRREATTDEAKKDEGKVKEGIAGLRKEMADSGARTLGEYFSKLDPEQCRIRHRYTHRDMYKDEFEKIWAAQAKHHTDVLTEKFKRVLRNAIFFQRPLKGQKNLIGECELEPGRKRAPVALLAAQRFRMLQKVNDLEIIQGDTGEVRPLTPEEREKLVRVLDREGDRTFKQIVKLLGLPKGSTFNLERGDEKKLPGNRTAAKLREVFGDRWDAMSPQDRDRIVEDLRSIQTPEALERRGMKEWGLDEEAAGKFSEVSLEDGYLSLSRQAIAKALPLMEEGKRWSTVRKELWPESFRPVESVDFLPRVREVLPELRNPAVERALTELRKVVNAVIREYGKPEIVRVELARDLKRPRKQREEAWKRMRANEEERERAKEKLLREAGIQEPRRDDVEKALLWEECGGICPYTGKAIPFKELFGGDTRFDVEHIIPFSRSLDNSFLNKTLCENEENRLRKGNRTPFEAYSGDPERYEKILGRVRRFKGEAAREKLRRFKMTEKDVEEWLENFSTRQLNDTRYASRLATKYLGMLYGGVIDEGHRRRVQVGAGQVTAYIRGELGLNGILRDGGDDGGEKWRGDHRHHAVDAVAIALTDARMVKTLSDAASRARAERRRRFASIQAPWPDFVDSIRGAVDGIVVSHRVSRKVRGALHEETNYSPPMRDENGREVRHVRKPLDGEFKSVDDIVDPRVREIVRKHLEAHENDPKKAFGNPQDMPFMMARDGRKIPIRKVRIRKVVNPVQVGQGPRARYVETRANHHVEIVEVEDGKWAGNVVTLLEAVRRKRSGEPVVRREKGFQFSLGLNEMVMMKHQGEAGLFKCTGVSEDEKGRVVLEFRRNNDARPAAMLKKIRGGRIRKTPDSLRECMDKQAGLWKVVVDPLGNVRRAND